MMLFAWFIYRHIIMIIRTLNTNYYKRMVNFTALKLRKAGVYSRVDDSNTSIGKRYARNDELGTPFGLTLDFACTLLFFRFWVPGLIPNNIFSHTRAWYYFFSFILEILNILGRLLKHVYCPVSSGRWRFKFFGLNWNSDFLPFFSCLSYSRREADYDSSVSLFLCTGILLFQIGCR